MGVLSISRLPYEPRVFFRYWLSLVFLGQQNDTVLDKICEKGHSHSTTVHESLGKLVFLSNNVLTNIS